MGFPHREFLRFLVASLCRNDKALWIIKAFSPAEVISKNTPALSKLQLKTVVVQGINEDLFEVR